MHGNARSPPTHPSILSEDFKPSKSARGPSGLSTTQPLSAPSTSKLAQKDGGSPAPSHIEISPNAIYPRHQREGYGFRPTSGSSTPTGSSASGLSPFVTVGSSREEDDTDHRPDGRSMESLREEVRGELVKHGGLAEQNGHGIADEEGLGWPGTFRSSRRDDADGIAKLTKQRLHSTPAEKAENLQVLSSALRTVLQCIGEDPDREGLQRTPERYAKALMWMTKGYEERLVDVINDAVFAEDHEEMVIVRDIDVFSLCEHHLVPFTGKVRSYLMRGRADDRSQSDTSQISWSWACRNSLV